MYATRYWTQYKRKKAKTPDYEFAKDIPYLPLWASYGQPNFFFFGGKIPRDIESALHQKRTSIIDQETVATIIIKQHDEVQPDGRRRVVRSFDDPTSSAVPVITKAKNAS